MATTPRVEQSYTQPKYGAYYFTLTDTFEGVAALYNVPVETLARMNNVKGNIPHYIYQAFTTNNDKSKISKSYISIPIVGNGGETNAPLYYYYEAMNLKPTEYAIQSATLQGTGGSVTLTINGIQLKLPCYPKSISDSTNANYTSDSLFTSTEPYVVYNNSGPRNVSVSFQFHREMQGLDHDPEIDNIVNTIQAACYPINDGSMGVETILEVGKEIYIRGVITGGVSVSYSGPIIDGKYNVIDLSFTIQEVYGNNISFGTKRNFGSIVRSGK